MSSLKYFPFLFSILLLVACSPGAEEEAEKETSGTPFLTTSLKEFSDKEYPDNPDISIRSPRYNRYSHPEVQFKALSKPGYYDLILPPGNKQSDTLFIQNVYLIEWIPALPEYVRGDSHMADICILNQEFNRQQVKLTNQNFALSGKGDEGEHTQRVDLARNCLNAGLWEVITFSRDKGGTYLPMYHGWFDFPMDLYGELFEQRNQLSFEEYKDRTLHWKDLPKKKVDLDLLRTVDRERKVKVTDQHADPYPMVGERQKKAPNIVNPKKFAAIDDFQSDSSSFATFAPPGIYKTSEPHGSELGRFRKVESAIYRETTPKVGLNRTYFEIDLAFSDPGRTTRLVVGGLMRSQILALAPEGANAGFQMPMGISNHSFYESYDFALKHPSEENPFFAMLLDEEGNWLDSHHIGIDGPLMHWDNEDPKKLHVWLLSFERHALVGHYILEL